MNNKFNEIVEAALNGDDRAFEELYSMTKRDAYFIAFGITKNEQDAWDIMHDSYIKAFENLATIKNPNRFDHWLNSIIANESKNYIKKKKPMLLEDVEQELAQQINEAELNSEYIPHEAADNAETNRLIMEIINRLDEDKRLVILLYYYQEMKVAEIAEALDMPVTTVKYKLLAARKDIKKEVEELEKRGTKLYSSPLAAIPAILMYFAMKSEVPAYADVTGAAAGMAAGATGTGINTGINAGQGYGTGADTSIGTEGSIGAGVAKSGFAKFISTVAGKVTIAVSSFVVVGAVIGIGIAVSSSDGGKSKSSSFDDSIMKETKETTAKVYEEITKEETTEEETYEEKEFEYNNVTELGYTAPSVHSEEKGAECTFLWTNTEMDIRNWLKDRYKDLEDDDHYDKIQVTNQNTVPAKNQIAMRTCRLDHNSYSKGADTYSVFMKTGEYSAKYIHSINFEYTSNEQETVITEAEAFLNFMGFGKYADTIIHSSNDLEIPVENRLGKYWIYHSYGFNQGEYHIRLEVFYSDSNYTADPSLLPENLETWEDDNEVKDWVTDSTLDTSSAKSFLLAIGNYLVKNVDSTVTFNADEIGGMDISYNYEIDPETGEKTNVEAYIKLMLSDKEKEYPQPRMENVTLQIHKSRFNIYVDVEPPYNHQVVRADNLTESEIDKLIDLHWNIIKLLNKNITLTKQDVRDSFNYNELNGETVYVSYEDKNYEYSIDSELENIILFIKKR